ncbi:MAG: DUF4258 domain-containing protein [Elusimicrobia bacterium]|nr:DUF4258 domain-containing protein [Elusimicrobiota bacterium]
MISQIQEQILKARYRLTQHAHVEMVDETIVLDEVFDAILEGKILEDYPEHKRGHCCLLCGKTKKGRFLHVVCTTGLSVLVLITVYEPKPPKWETPFKRGGEKL